MFFFKLGTSHFSAVIRSAIYSKLVFFFFYSRHLKGYDFAHISTNIKYKNLPCSANGDQA